jgi:monofunctional glycosyltransferase
MNQPDNRFQKILSLVWRAIKGLFLLYAVAFSIAGTLVLVGAYRYVVSPVRQIKTLQKNNPKETVYMARLRAAMGAHDTLSQIFVPLDSIAKELQHAVLAAEDDGFYTHPGIDLEAILAAMEYNRTQNGIKRGASTITQQLAKNLFLTNDKSFQRKYRELLYTVLMEKYLGKKRILELYLNYAQWGKTVFGCEAASRYYFKKASRNLSRYEAARLAAVLAMPNRVSPLNVNSTFIGSRMTVIANNLYLHHFIDDSGYFDLTGTRPPGKDSLDTVGAPSPDTTDD